MNKDINSLYEQYKSLGNPETFDEFVQLKEQAGEDIFFEFMNNYVSDSLKKKENSQETPSNSSSLGENQPTPISAQGNPQITSVPISQDLDLNQAQVEAMQGVQNPAILNLESPQQSVNQNGLLESNGAVDTSSSALEDSFNNFIQEGGELPLNATSTRLNVLPRAYENQFNNVTESIPQVSESGNINTTNNDFVDFGNGITLPKELLPEEKTKEEFNKEIAESAKDVTLKQSGKLGTFDIENPKWISRNIGDLQGENYVNDILQKEKEGKVKVARNEKGELIDKDLKPILDNSNVLWQPIGSYINDYNNDVNEFNKEIELNNQKVSQNNALIESQNIRDLFLGKKEEPKSPLTTLYNKIYSDTGILLTEEQKAQFNSIDDVYNFYASEKAKKEVQKNPNLNYNEEYNKLVNELNPKISTQQSLQLGKNFVNNFLLGFRIEEEKSFNEARGYGAKIDPSYQKGYNSKDDLQEINFINNLSNNDYGLGLIGEWWNAVGKKEIGTTNYKINATLSTPEGRADVINSIANYINGRGSIQKELAYENIQREKFNNLKNAKKGNVLALQDSINFIQSESNKINQIDKQQKEIYDFIDSWKKTQIRNNKKEQEFAKTYSGYQSGEILPSIKIIAGNTVNGISDAVKSTIAGVAQLPNLAIGSDEYNDVISEIKKPSEFFGVKTSGMFSKYYDYKSGGKDIRFQNGNYYELVNGDYRPINLTYAQISNLGKSKEGEEFSIAGMIGDTTRMATEIGLSEFTGAVSLKALSKFSQLRNIERVSSVFGEESALTNSLQRLERFSKNPTNNGYFGWFTQTIADNYQEAKAKGMTNTQASIYGSVQSLLTSFLSRINPDVKFFRTYKEIDEKLIGSLLRNDKQGFLNNLKSLSNHVGGEISSETGQELTEQFAQELVRQFYNTSLTDKKFDTMTADDVLKTVITTAITTGALTSSNLTLRGSGDNIINYDNAYYNSTQLSEGQKLVMLANLNTSEIFKNFNNQFISDKNKLNEIEQTVKSVKTYLDKIPNKDKYTLNTQTKAVSLLYKIDQKRKELNKADESFKDDINNEINDLTDNLKQLLNDDLKLQNEQPQQTTQSEQTQETAQGQTTETTLQPKQGTTTTEQSVSADVVNNNQNIQDNGKKDTRTTVQEQSSGEKMLGNEQRSQENGQNTDLGLSSMGEQNQEQRQTTQQVEEVATNITEEDDLLSVLNAIKNLKQEQQVQVSPSEEAVNVQQNDAFSVNEQPQTIEQQSETQTTTLASESKSTNGKYTIRVQPNSNTGIADAKIFDNNGNEVKLTNKQKEKYVAEHFAKQSYPETVVENMDKLRSDEYSRAIVDATNNPLELAQILDTESKFLPSESLNAKENAIANVIGNKVSRSSFIQFDDVNNISFSIARGYGLTNKGKTIDVIAQEAEVFIYGDWDSQNPRVTTEDVIDFMKTYNNGAETFFTQPNQVYRDAEAKFEKLTGIKATKNALDVLLGKKTATKIDFAKLQEEADILSAEEKYNLRNEYNEWFNSLSLEDKNLELQKTYPYEQRTEENTNQSQNESVPNRQSESSKNVANQERDGATTEKITVKKYFDAYSTLPFGQNGNLENNGVTSTETGRKIRFGAELSDGSIVSLDGVIRITKPEVWKKIKDFYISATGSKKVKVLLEKAFNIDEVKSMLDNLYDDIIKNGINLDELMSSSKNRKEFFKNTLFSGLENTELNIQGEKINPTQYLFSKDFDSKRQKTEQVSQDENKYNNVKVTYTQFGEQKKGILEINEDGIYRIKGEDGRIYNPYSSLVKNLKDAEGNSIQLQKGNQRLTPITKQAFDALVTKLQKAFPRFAKVTYDFEAFKKQAESKGFNINFDYRFSIKNDRKSRQLEIINKTNPAPNTYNTWIRNISDIKTAEEAFRSAFEDGEMYPDFTVDDMQKVLDTGKVTVYSSYPIKEGVFVTPSKMNAEDYAGGRGKKVYSKEIDANDLAWIDESEGQYAPVQFMQTPNGTIYGAKLPDGTIYLNPEFLNANTPIHEFSHLFEQLLPSRFKKGVELLKQTNLGKKLFEQLKQEGNYANLTDEQLWSEALNTHIGNFGENEVNNTKGKLKQLQDWIKDFFAKVGDVLGIKKLSTDTQLRMFTEGVVKDLLGGKPIVAENQVSLSEQVQFSINSNISLSTQSIKDIVNEIENSGKESGFAKLQETEWYRNLSEDQKAKINTDNILDVLQEEGRKLLADKNAQYNQIKTTTRGWMKSFKEKWFANQGGLLKPFLQYKDRAIGLANWEMRVAKNTVEQLTDEANKIGFNTESNWEIFNNALQGDVVSIDKLPETIKPFITRMRSQIDGLSLQLIENNLVSKSQAVNIEENLGKYITRGYSIFEGDSNTEKVSKKFFRMLFKKENSIVARFDRAKWADAVTVFQQNVLNEIASDSSDKYSKYDTDEKKQSYARKEGERRLLNYISELESDYKQKGSEVGADTSVLERRKEIAEPIRKLLGEYTDPKISFLLTVSRVSNLAYQRKFLSQVRELGIGKFLFEEGDANIPVENYVKIASDTNGRFSPLNGLYTSPEFKDVFLDVNENNYNELANLWLKATGLIKVGKTVLSPITQAVNFNANFGFLINNGLILDVKQIGTAFKAFADDISNGRLDNVVVQELIEENILGQNVNFNELEKDFGINMEKEIIKTFNQSNGVKIAREVLDIPFRLYRASDDFFKAFAYYSEADRYADAYFGKKYKELEGEDRLKIRKLASEIVKNTMPNYDRRYKAADLARKKTYNLVGNFLAFQAESIRTKINSVQYAISDLKNEQTRKAGLKRLSGIMAYESIYMTVTTMLTKSAGMGMVGLLGFFDDEDEDEKNKKFNMMMPEWGRSTEKYFKHENDGSITWYAYGNSNPYGIWYKTANAYFNGSSNSEGGLVSVLDELLTPFTGTEMSAKWFANTFISERNDYGVSLLTPKDKIDYTIEKLSPSFVKLIKDNTDSNNKNNFDIYNVLGVKKYNFNPTQQLNFKYNDYAKLINDLGEKKYGLEMKVKNGNATLEEVQSQWQDYDNKQKEYADELREVIDAYVSFGADPTYIDKKARKSYQFKYNSVNDWWDYITRPE